MSAQTCKRDKISESIAIFQRFSQSTIFFRLNISLGLIYFFYFYEFNFSTKPKCLLHRVYQQNTTRAHNILTASRSIRLSTPQ